MCTERIKKLRVETLNKEVKNWTSDEGCLLWNRGWKNACDENNIIRRAMAKAYLLEHSTPIIDEYELIVGKPNYKALDDSEQEELNTYNNLYSKFMLHNPGMASHMAIDYDRLLKYGVSGVRGMIDEYRSNLKIELPEDMEKNEFYKACQIVLDGVITYAERYAKHAENLAKDCIGTPRYDELVEIARICRRVPRYPAETFREALQSIHFITFFLEGLYQLGRPDRYLIDYYRNDIKKNIIRKDFAQELIDCLCIMFNEYIPKGLAVGFMVGGRDENGVDVTNELTYMFIESIGHTRLIYPGIGLCYTSDTPNDLLQRSCELLSESLSHPALFNDDVIIGGMIKYGLPYSDACMYIHSTCVEITPIANSAVWVASPYHNLVQILLDIMKSHSNDINSFEELKKVYRKQLIDVIRQQVIVQNKMQMSRMHYGGDPLVSCFVHDCLEKGLDIDQGGARYNWIMPSFVGLANLADSFINLKRLVFDEKRSTISEFNDILSANFENNEALKLELLNKFPKYGNDNDEADEMVQEITRWITEDIGQFKTYRGDCFIPSLFCWIMHEQFGTNTNATPDGRSAGFPLGDGSGPAQGREKKGPTAAILSSTKWDHRPYIGGIAVNMKFGKSMFKGESINRIMDLIRTFMEKGGFEMQVNVVDNKTLLKARETPEAYQDLVVRVGGYSDYFVHLSPAMQEEVMLRTEHII